MSFYCQIRLKMKTWIILGKNINDSSLGFIFMSYIISIYNIIY